VNRASRRAASRGRWSAGYFPPPAVCGVCSGELSSGEDYRLLVDTTGGTVAGHLECVDALAGEMVALGGVDLGEVDFR